MTNIRKEVNVTKCVAASLANMNIVHTRKYSQRTLILWKYNRIYSSRNYYPRSMRLIQFGIWSNRNRETESKKYACDIFVEEERKKTV